MNNSSFKIKLSFNDRTGGKNAGDNSMHRVQFRPNSGNENMWRRTHTKSLKASVKRYSDGRASGKRGRDRRGVERRVDATVANAVAAADLGHRGKPVDRRRAGCEKPARTNQGKIAGADDHALPRTGQLDRAAGHRENVHCHSKRQRR